MRTTRAADRQLATLALTFAFAAWQNHAGLQVLNRPLANVGSPSLTDHPGSVPWVPLL